MFEGRRSRRPTAHNESRGTRGAVYVEFLIAFLPIFIFFESLVQLAGLYAAQLVVAHAAETAARAAIVVLPDDPKFYDDVPVNHCTGRRRADIVQAATVPLRAIQSIIAVRVTFPSGPFSHDDRKRFGPHELVRVKVQASYKCNVPLAGRLVCNPLTGTRILAAEAALPNNGARYAYSD